jgi:hypothetical protein
MAQKSAQTPQSVLGVVARRPRMNRTLAVGIGVIVVIIVIAAIILIKL